MFLTGKTGTGKSTLIRLFMAETDRNVVVAAPTGIAALNVDGYTVHRLFGFRLYQLPPVVSEGEAQFFSTTYETPYFFSAPSFRREDFPPWR